MSVHRPKREPKVVNGWTVNKQTMLKHISDELYGYVLDHTREPEVSTGLPTVVYAAILFAEPVVVSVV